MRVEAYPPGTSYGGPYPLGFRKGVGEYFSDYVARTLYVGVHRLSCGRTDQPTSHAPPRIRLSLLWKFVVWEKALGSVGLIREHHGNADFLCLVTKRIHETRDRHACERLVVALAEIAGLLPALALAHDQ